jgi:glyoxylase-like metal-dependent hydrolase (beta-lactamase superfamily II)
MFETVTAHLTIFTYPVGVLDTNCYLVWHESTREVIVIDPGDDGDQLSQEIVNLGAELKGIWLTHGHFDHNGGLLPLKLNWPQAPIGLDFADRKLYQNATHSAKYWGARELDPLPPPEIDWGKTQRWTWGDQEWQVIKTPGHTPGAVSFYQADDGLLFSGDTLFKEAVGRTDFSYALPEEMKRSLARLVQLPGETRVFPGHGRPTTIAAEKSWLKAQGLVK